MKSNTEKETKVINYARSKVGCGYCWATYGQTMSEKLLSNLVAEYGESKIQPAKQRKYNMGKQVFDCAGLVAKAYNQVGIKPYTGATGNWNKLKYAQKGRLSEMPRDKVAILFNGDGTNMKHTGIYIKNDRFVHAKGTDYGVLEESMSAYSWTHYGIPEGFYGPGDLNPTEPSEPSTPTSFPFKGRVHATSGSTVNLRKEPTTNSKILKQVKLKEIVTVIGEENGWYHVNYEEFQGYMMKKFVEKI